MQTFNWLKKLCSRETFSPISGLSQESFSYPVCGTLNGNRAAQRILGEMHSVLLVGGGGASSFLGWFIASEVCKIIRKLWCI